MARKTIFCCLVFCSFVTWSLDKLDECTKKSIADIYDVQALGVITRIEEYFACSQPTIFEDAVRLDASSGQMEQGYRIVMTPGLPLQIEGKCGRYVLNNFADPGMTADEMAKFLKKNFDARAVFWHFDAHNKTTTFEITKFKNDKLPTPIERKRQDFVRAEEAHHAFTSMYQSYQDNRANEQLAREAVTSDDDEKFSHDSICKEWQPIQKVTYASLPNVVQPFFLYAYAGKVKAAFSRWYWGS